MENAGFVRGSSGRKSFREEWKTVENSLSSIHELPLSLGVYLCRGTVRDSGSFQNGLCNHKGNYETLNWF
jgi:hypothetical protein